MPLMLLEFELLVIATEPAMRANEYRDDFLAYCCCRLACGTPAYDYSIFREDAVQYLYERHWLSNMNLAS